MNKIGLEIHMHLKTKEKLFCTCRIPKKNDKINSIICEVCTGQPGAKPKLTNIEAVKDVIKLGLVFNSKITKKTNFQRKHYSWPDMPTGFQRTVSGSHIKENCVGGSFLGIGIEDVHLEEDPAAWDPITGEVNYNRSGFPLAEIVTKPEFKNTAELRKWLEELILVGKYLNVLNEDYGIKSDVNVSIKESGYRRVEIKNVSSLSSIVKAAEIEIERQRSVVKQGGKISMETRRFNENTLETEFMRSKENAQDYMFMPEPDLPNLIIDDEFILEIKKLIPELPLKKRERYLKYNLSKEDIEVLVSNLYLTQIFEYAIANKLNPKEVGLFLRREIPRILNYYKHTFFDLEKKDIKEEITKLIELLGQDKISYKTAQKVLEKLYENKFSVEKYIKDNNLIQVQDDLIIKEIVKTALLEAPKAIEDYKKGNLKSLNFIVGIVMRKTNGTAKPNLVNKILLEEVKKL